MDQARCAAVRRRKPIVIGRAGSAPATSRSGRFRDIDGHGLRLRAAEPAAVGIAIAAGQIADELTFSDRLCAPA
jgi:hypothetical protein